MPVDLPLRQAWQTARLLWRVRRFFGRALETPFLAEARAFPGLAYHTIIYLWMQFTGVDRQTLLRRRGFELYALLSEYSLTIDAFIDTTEGRRAVQDRPRLLKDRPEFRRYVEYMGRWLRCIPMRRETRRALAATVQRYRYRALQAVQTAVRLDPLAPLELIMPVKLDTSGAAFATCVELLNLGYEIPASEADDLTAMFRAWGMALQVTDDLADLPLDYALVHNLAASCLAQHADEHRRVIQAADLPPHGDLIPRLAPQTYAQIKGLLKAYLAETTAVGRGHPLVADMRAVAYTLFRLATRRRAGLMFQGYVSHTLQALKSRHQERHVAA